MQMVSVINQVNADKIVANRIQKRSTGWTAKRAVKVGSVNTFEGDGLASIGDNSQRSVEGLSNGLYGTQQNHFWMQLL